MTRLNREHLLGLSCLAVSAVTFVLSAQLPKGQSAASVSGPALFPIILALILLGSGIAEIVIGFAKGASFPALNLAGAWKQLKRPEVVNVFLIIAFWILYELLFQPLGFIVTTLLFLFAVMVRLGVGPVRSVVYAVMYVVVIYLMFTVLFSIPLPAGVLSLLGM